MRMSVRNQVPQYRLARFTAGIAPFAMIVALCAAAEATIVAEFTGGNGTAAPDQYEGTAGDGWLTPWSTDDGISRDGTWTNTVASTNPVAGGGNYLDGRVEISGILGGDAVLWRQHAEGGATGVSYIGPHTISWQFRVDATSNFNPDWNQLRFDTIRFHDPVDPIDDNTTWWIELANPDTPYTQWQFLTFIGGNAFAYIPTDVRFVIGDVYEFQVALSDAASGTWDGTVTNLNWDASDGGVASTTITDLLLEACKQVADSRWKREFLTSMQTLSRAASTSRSIRCRSAEWPQFPRRG